MDLRERLDAVAADLKEVVSELSRLDEERRAASAGVPATDPPPVIGGLQIVNLPARRPDRRRARPRRPRGARRQPGQAERRAAAAMIVSPPWGAGFANPEQAQNGTAVIPFLFRNEAKHSRPDFTEIEKCPDVPVPSFKVIAAAPASAVPAPPCKLGAVGMSLWSDITASYEFGDRASVRDVGAGLRGS